MDYKNLFLRILVSIFFLLLYVIVSTFDKNYLIFFIIILYLFALFEVNKYFKNKILINLYILSSFVLFYIYFIYFFDYIYFNLFLLIIITFDIFSYLFGSQLGKKRILPKISPNKTIAGFFYGVICSNIFSLIYINIFYKINLFYFLFINLVIIFAFVGDIIESYFKRISNIKNASNILPGHGGFFDRIDSFMISIFVLLVFSYIQ